MLAEVRKKGKNIKKFYGDGAYDANLFFSSLKDAEGALEGQTRPRIALAALREEGTR